MKRAMLRWVSEYPVGEFESEGDRLRMDPVRAADHGSVLELPGSALEDLGEAFQILCDDFRRLVDQ